MTYSGGHFSHRYGAGERGDALVFVSGADEIRRLMEPLRHYAARLEIAFHL
jgi:HrpA-like RNA helicase